MPSAAAVIGVSGPDVVGPRAVRIFSRCPARSSNFSTWILRPRLLARFMVFCGGVRGSRAGGGEGVPWQAEWGATGTPRTLASLADVFHPSPSCKCQYAT